MRKITLNPNFGNQPVNPDWNHNRIVIKNGNDLKEFKAPKKIFNSHRYSADQLKSISEVNHVLEQNNQPLMSEEEVEYLLYPFGKEKQVDAEDLQYLAGFRVEKTIFKIGD